MIVAPSETNSLVRAGSRSAFPSAYRYSTRIFLPSLYPKSAKPDRNASTPARSEGSLAKESQPIVGIARCCACRQRPSDRRADYRDQLPPSHRSAWPELRKLGEHIISLRLQRITNDATQRRSIVEVRRCYEPDEGCRSFPAISFVQVVIGRKGDTGKWIAQLTPQLLRIGSSAPWS